MTIYGGIYRQTSVNFRVTNDAPQKLLQYSAKTYRTQSIDKLKENQRSDWYKLHRDDQPWNLKTLSSKDTEGLQYYLGRICPGILGDELLTHIRKSRFAVLNNTYYPTPAQIRGINKVYATMGKAYYETHGIYLDSNKIDLHQMFDVIKKYALNELKNTQHEGTNKMKVNLTQAQPLLTNIIAKKEAKTQKLDKEQVLDKFTENFIEAAQNGVYTNRDAAGILAQRYMNKLNAIADDAEKQQNVALQSKTQDDLKIEKQDLLNRLNVLAYYAKTYHNTQLNIEGVEISTDSSESDTPILSINAIEQETNDIVENLNIINEKLGLSNLKIPNVTLIDIDAAKSQKKDIHTQINVLKYQKQQEQADLIATEAQLGQIIKSGTVKKDEIIKPVTQAKPAAKPTPIEFIQIYLKEVGELRNSGYINEQFATKEQGHARIDTLLKACQNLATKNNIDLSQFEEFEESKTN